MVKNRPIKSDLRKIDQHEITPEEYTDAPEITGEMLARAEIKKSPRTSNVQGSPKR